MVERLELHQSLPPYQVVAFNYATDSENKIHSDEVAPRFGFRGGLVPGVGDYAYLSRPIVETLGLGWLERGSMEAKLLKPVYDGDSVSVRAQVTGTDPVTLSLELLDGEGQLCAVATAGLPRAGSEPEPDAYPVEPLPEFDRRPPARLANLPVGKTLGSLELEVDLAAMHRRMLPQFRDTLPLYSGPDAVLHPAFYPEQGNQILYHNVKLGPWIHTASKVRHFALPQDQERLTLRGRVREAYEKRGHEIVVLDLAFFGQGLRAIAAIEHAAIVRPRGSQD